MQKITLDIDTTDKDFIQHNGLKIMLCPYCYDFNPKPSDKKGYHFIVKCLIKCDICRMVYDDFIRFAFDTKRPVWAQNILFDKKEGVKF